MTNALAIDLSAACWIVTKTPNNKGYATMRIERGGRPVLVHRYMWALMRGPIPVDLEIDHLCKVRNCVNPQHMELVTHRENLRRGDGPIGRHARATHCPQGHAYDEANTYRYPDGSRRCRSCARAHDRRRRPRLAYRFTPEGIDDYRWSCR